MPLCSAQNFKESPCDRTLYLSVRDTDRLFIFPVATEGKPLEQQQSMVFIALKKVAKFPFYLRLSKTFATT